MCQVLYFSGVDQVFQMKMTLFDPAVFCLYSLFLDGSKLFAFLPFFPLILPPVFRRRYAMKFSSKVRIGPLSLEYLLDIARLLRWL